MHNTHILKLKQRNILVETPKSIVETPKSNETFVVVKEKLFILKDLLLLICRTIMFAIYLSKF